MDARMQLIARSVQVAVMAAPSSSLDEAIALARRHRESLATFFRRMLAPAAPQTHLT